VQGFEMQVLRGMRRTLEANPDLILLLEVFPDGLREAGSAGAELMTFLQAKGFTGYEFSEWRVQPIGPPKIYDWIASGKDVDCVLSRNANLVDRLAADYLSTHLFPEEIPAKQSSRLVSPCPVERA
jgi:hypothetical protein